MINIFLIILLHILNLCDYTKEKGNIVLNYEKLDSVFIKSNYSFDSVISYQTRANCKSFVNKMISRFGANYSFCKGRSKYQSDIYSWDEIKAFGKDSLEITIAIAPVDNYQEIQILVYDKFKELIIRDSLVFSFFRNQLYQNFKKQNNILIKSNEK